MANNWTFDKTGQARHIPCSGLAYYDFKNPLKCYICHEQLPKELELPAKVFGAYRFISLAYIEELFNKTLQEKMKEVEKQFFLGMYNGK